MFRIPGLMFEAVIDGSAATPGGGESTPVEPVAPVAAEPAVAPVEATPAPAAAIDYDDPRILDLVDNRAAQIAQQQLEQYLQRAQAQQPQGQQAFDPASLMDDYGNLDPVKFAAWSEQRDRSLVDQVQQMFSPLAQQMQAQQEAEVLASGEARLEDMLADDIAKNGEFASTPEADKAARERVRRAADAMFPKIAERYGATARAAEIAMSRAAGEEREYLRAVRGEAQAQQANQLATLAGRPGEPGGVGAAAAVSRPVVRFGERVTDRYAAGGNPIQ